MTFNFRVDRETSFIPKHIAPPGQKPMMNPPVFYKDVAPAGAITESTVFTTLNFEDRIVFRNLLFY